MSAEPFLETLRASAGAVRPLLIFDQFEEWITLFEESSSGQRSNGVRASRERIRDAIISLINDITLPVKVLIALREDYLAKLIPFFQRCPSLPDQYLRLDSLSGEQVYQAICGPFERYPGIYQPELTSELAREIRGQFEERSGASDIRLTEVQIVCQGLFESGKEGKDLEGFFTKQGGVKGILEHYLERRLELLPLDQQEPAVGLLTRMVTSAGTRNVISRDDLLKRVELEYEIKPEVLAETLDNLEQNTKLLRRERRREVYFYEIASEFLVEWIRKKAQERQRLMDRKKLEEAQRRIEQAKIAKIFRRFSIALVIVSLLVVTAAVMAWMARERAIEHARIAEKQALNAEKQAYLALSERERAEEQEQARIALSGQLAVQAFFKMDAKLDLALLLSIEATRITDNVEGRASLLYILFYHGHLGNPLHILLGINPFPYLFFVPFFALRDETQAIHLVGEFGSDNVQECHPYIYQLRFNNDLFFAKDRDLNYLGKEHKWINEPL